MSICRWGFLSAAEIAQKNWRSVLLAENATLTAVASRSLPRAEDFISRCQAHSPFDSAPKAYGSYDDLISSDEADAVYIPLPTGVRKEWAIKAASAGKHVLLEKPCAKNASDLEEILAACSANNVQFMDGVMLMHSQRLPKVRSVIDDKVGEIRRMTTNFCFSAPDEFFANNIRASADLEPHGCLGDVGWYCIRMILWAMKWQVPNMVTGRIIQATDQGVPIEFAGELIFEDNVTASFYCSFVTATEQLFEVAGTKGSVRLDDFVLPVVGDEAEFSSASPAFAVDVCDFQMDHQREIHSVTEPSHGKSGAQEVRMIERFSAAAMSGNPEAEWGEYSLKTQKVMDGCYGSAKSGCTETPVSN